jgi:hypothetical protein
MTGELQAHLAHQNASGPGTKIGEHYEKDWQIWRFWSTKENKGVREMVRVTLILRKKSAVCSLGYNERTKSLRRRLVRHSRQPMNSCN